jgi:hypothetical protein
LKTMQDQVDRMEADQTAFKRTTRHESMLMRKRINSLDGVDRRGGARAAVPDTPVAPVRGERDPGGERAAPGGAAADLPDTIMAGERDPGGERAAPGGAAADLPDRIMAGERDPDEEEAAGGRGHGAAARRPHVGAARHPHHARKDFLNPYYPHSPNLQETRIVDWLTSTSLGKIINPKYRAMRTNFTRLAGLLNGMNKFTVEFPTHKQQFDTLFHKVFEVPTGFIENHFWGNSDGLDGTEQDAFIQLMVTGIKQLSTDKPQPKLFLSTMAFVQCLSRWNSKGSAFGIHMFGYVLWQTLTSSVTMNRRISNQLERGVEAWGQNNEALTHAYEAIVESAPCVKIQDRVAGVGRDHRE